jgi:hypothetical protein
MIAEIDLRIGFAQAMTKKGWGILSGDEIDTIPNSPSINLFAARNEVIGVQVLLGARQDFVLILDNANWLHPLGFTPRLRLEIRFPSLPEGAVEAFPVGYVEGDDRRLWMESLDRVGYTEVPAFRPQSVYLRIHIPAALDPGLHQGQVRAFTQFGFEDETLCWEGTIRLQVYRAILPDVRDWSIHLNLWQHCTAIARYYRVPLWSEAHFALIDRYYASLARLGQKAVSVMATEIPWSGQRCYRDRAYPAYLFEHAIVEVSRDLVGQLHFDYRKLDRLLDLAARHAIDREIDIFGLLNIWVDPEFGFSKLALDAPDAMRVRCYDQATETYTYLRTAAGLRAFIRGLHDHLQAKGLLDRVRIFADEPGDLEEFKKRLDLVKSAGPDFKYSVAINHYEFLEFIPPEVVDAVPIITLACQDPALTAAYRERLHARGGHMDWYVCCWPPVPNTFLHSPLVEAQLHGWFTFYARLDGFLRWAFCLWTAEPWRRVSWRAPNWPAGDMYFVLPGNDGAPVETLRYEGLRTGFQDYELLKLAERLLPPDAAQALFTRAFACILRVGSLQAFSEVATAKAENLYSLDPSDYQAARRLVLEALDNLPTRD